MLSKCLCWVGFIFFMFAVYQLEDAIESKIKARHRAKAEAYQKSLNDYLEVTHSDPNWIGE